MTHIKDEEISLRKFFNKNAKIIFHDNEVLNSYVETFTPSYDSFENEDEIAILSIDKKLPLIGIRISEIKSIELIY
ncbi:hypothetical protein [uncultured Anaerococcus sp.]|uniref:hypothetical protein n=1 Tax=uncultured Anaerococcus sp. TaxID=293428 RepID=UPI00288AA53B|nr:hypothetical protein [uncultured Anaerococcus sp.]